MPNKRYRPEEIISKLREADVLISQGRKVVDVIKRLKELEKDNERLRKAVSDLTLDKMILREAAKGKLLSPSRRRAFVRVVCEGLKISERRACQVLGQYRSTQRHVAVVKSDEEALTKAIVGLATQ